jgi:hypothetical protein
VETRNEYACSKPIIKDTDIEDEDTNIEMLQESSRPWDQVSATDLLINLTVETRTGAACFQKDIDIEMRDKNFRRSDQGFALTRFLEHFFRYA